MAGIETGGCQLHGADTALSDHYLSGRQFGAGEHLFPGVGAMIEDAFAGWGSDIAVLGTLDRFRVLHGMLRPGEEFPQVVLRETQQDWKVMCCHGASSSLMIT